MKLLLHKNGIEFFFFLNIYGQTISKANYGVLNYPQKTNEKLLSCIFPIEKMLWILIFLFVY